MEEKTIKLKKGDIVNAMFHLTDKDPLTKLVHKNPTMFLLFPIIAMELEEHFGLIEKKKEESEAK